MADTELHAADNLLTNFMVCDSGINRSDEDYVRTISELMPVTHTFGVEQTPEGEAPEDIRQQWVGLRLPVRALLIGQTVPILAVDGIVALDREGRAEAGDWWRNFYETDSKLNLNLRTGMPLLLNPWARREGLLARISFLGFDINWGEFAET